MLIKLNKGQMTVCTVKGLLIVTNPQRIITQLCCAPHLLQVIEYLSDHQFAFMADSKPLFGFSATAFISQQPAAVVSEKALIKP